jgi:hypothetical protein
MPRPVQFQTAEQKLEARRLRNHRYYMKKKIGGPAAKWQLPSTGIFVTHDAASLLGENAAVGILPNTPQDVGILADNLDLLGLAATQSQSIITDTQESLSVGNSQQSPLVRDTPPASPTSSPPDIFLAPHPYNVAQDLPLPDESYIRDDDVLESPLSRFSTPLATPIPCRLTPVSQRLTLVESLTYDIANLQVTTALHPISDRVISVASTHSDDDSNDIDDDMDNITITDDRDTEQMDEEAQARADNIRVVKWLSEQLIEFHMCCDHCHKMQRVGHPPQSDLHNDLEHTFGDFDVDADSPAIPYVLNSPTLLKTSDNKPQLQDIWRAMEGQRSDQDFSQVCLHWYDRVWGGKPTSFFDFDSILAFPTSLAVARLGLSYTPIGANVSHLKTDLHITMRVKYLDESGRQYDKAMSMHKVPHYRFGNLTGWPEISLYIMFPGLFSDDRPSTHLTQDQMRQWTDNILLPAIYKYLPSSVKQHLPSSYDHSYHASLAKGKEQRAKGSRAYQSRIQLLSYQLKPEYLSDIWSRILELVETPDLQHFRGIQLFLNGKNLKLATQERTLEATCKNWNRRWQTSIHERHLNLDTTFIDIGKETCAPYSYLPDEDFPPICHPQVYLWRKCCLDSYYRESLLGDPARLSLRRFYPQSMLRDSAALTILTAKKSKARASGLIYSQFYNSIKEMTDAAQSHPFDNSGLESLALDRDIFKTFQSTARSHNHHIGVIRDSYLHSKARVHASLEGSMQKSFGTREEHRMSLTLLRQLIDSWKATGVYDQRIQLGHRVPFYTIPTFHFLLFLRANINKFAWAFEYTLATCEPNYISWERTKLMVLFLRYLRLSIGSQNLAAESVIWLDRKTVVWRVDDNEENVIKEGMGASKTMADDGYCWMLPKIDWAHWQFDKQHSKNMTIGNPNMLKAYRRRADEVGDIQELWMRFDELNSWLIGNPTHQ